MLETRDFDVVSFQIDVKEVTVFGIRHCVSIAEPSKGADKVVQRQDTGH